MGALDIALACVTFVALVIAREWCYRRGAADYRRLKAWLDRDGGHHGH